MNWLPCDSFQGTQGCLHPGTYQHQVIVNAGATSSPAFKLLQSAQPELRSQQGLLIRTIAAAHSIVDSQRHCRQIVEVPARETNSHGHHKADHWREDTQCESQSVPC